MSTLKTPYNIRQIAVGCLYLLTNKATLDFPGSDRSKPSRDVVVGLATRSLHRKSDQVYFPFKLGWGVWHDAIAPVLTNKDVQVIVEDNPSLRVQPNDYLIRHSLYDDLVSKIEAYLLVSLVSKGYLPGEMLPEDGDDGVLESCPSDPAPVNWNPGGSDSVDPDLRHPDGTPKLTYQVVDR